MKSRWRILILLTSVAVIALLLVELAIRKEHEARMNVHRPPSFVTSPLRGQILDVAHLKKNESVLVECVYLACTGSDYATRYLIGGDVQWMTVWDCKISWAFTPEPTIVSPVLRGAFPFDDRDLRGVASMIQAFRFRPQNNSTAAVAYRIEYRRGDATVGEERFILPPAFELRPTVDWSDDLKHVAEDYRIPAALAMSIVSPELIATREANNSPEATSGTRPPATPSPSSGAPHL